MDELLQSYQYGLVQFQCLYRGISLHDFLVFQFPNSNFDCFGQEGVVFVLSGFVNPERGILRSQALEMGAEYRADWTSDCTLLVCAFPNTPKFRQVEADCGTIVSKVAISFISAVLYSIYLPMPVK